jgi:hypothetical protein
MLLFRNTSLPAGATDGTWVNVPSYANRGVENAPLVRSVTGTATVIVEGRVSDLDTTVQISSGTTTAGVLTLMYPQMRVRITGATAGASVTVSLGR